MNILIIDLDFVGLDFALRCMEYGHKVKWYRYSTKPSNIGTKLGLDIVEDWRPHMPWARDGLIWITDNKRFMIELDRYREMGYKIFGPSAQSAELEIDRNKGMKTLLSSGVDVPICREFDNVKSAFDFAWKSDRAWVFKSLGDNADKSSTYVSDDAADLCSWLDLKIQSGIGIDSKCILQEKIDLLCEMCVLGIFGPDGFLPDRWLEGFEHKRLMSGDCGPNCYSEDTEVLTESGWKFWPDVTSGDKIATLVDGYLTYEIPSQLVSAEFDGELISWKSNRVDLLVTPGHQMYVADRCTIRNGYPRFSFMNAINVSQDKRDKGFALLKTSGWKAIDDTIDPDYARLLGMFLADGYCRERSIIFGNCPQHKEGLIHKAALACGYVTHRYGPDLYINSKYLADLWREFPKSPEKRCPVAIMNSSPIVISAFLDGLALDATVRSGNLTYSTASKGMADDIQILAQKIGMCGTILERDRRDVPDRYINGYLIRGSLSWSIGISNQALAWLRPNFCKRVQYKGKVYCATVSTHVLLVRRNGKVCWNGQTGEMGTVQKYVKESLLAEEVLIPLTTALHVLGHCGFVDVNVGIDKSGRVWPFEITARPGWPQFYIQQAAHRGDPAQWMRDLLEGKDTLRVSYDTTIGVVCAQFPKFPYYGPIMPDMVEGYTISGIDDQIYDNIHPSEVMGGKGIVMKEGKVARGDVWKTSGEYVMVVTAQGKSISKARDKAYTIVDQIKFPNKTFRCDIGCKVIEVLSKLKEFGYAEDFTA